MSDMFSDEICEGIWEDPDQKNQLTVLLKSETDGQYTLCTSEDTGLWKRFFEKFTQADVDQFTERNRQRRVIEEKKQVFQCIASKYQSYLEDFEIPITQGVMGRAVLNKKCLSIPDFKYETIKFVIDKEFNNLIYKK